MITVHDGGDATADTPKGSLWARIQNGVKNGIQTVGNGVESIITQTKKLATGAILASGISAITPNAMATPLPEYGTIPPVVAPAQGNTMRHAVVLERMTAMEFAVRYFATPDCSRLLVKETGALLSPLDMVKPGMTIMLAVSPEQALSFSTLIASRLPKKRPDISTPSPVLEKNILTPLAGKRVSHKTANLRDLNLAKIGQLPEGTANIDVSRSIIDNRGGEHGGFFVPIITASGDQGYIGLSLIAPEMRATIQRLALQKGNLNPSLAIPKSIEKPVLGISQKIEGTSLEWHGQLVSVKDFLANARELLGNPYLYGGTGKDKEHPGIDCSAFVQKAIGVGDPTYPRLTSHLIAGLIKKQTKPIQAAQPGDIIYTINPAHVVIVTARPRGTTIRTIYASSGSGKVIEVDLPITSNMIVGTPDWLKPEVSPTIQVKGELSQPELLHPPIIDISQPIADLGSLRSLSAQNDASYGSSEISSIVPLSVPVGDPLMTNAIALSQIPVTSAAGNSILKDMSTYLATGNNATKDLKHQSLYKMLLAFREGIAHKKQSMIQAERMMRQVITPDTIAGFTRAKIDVARAHLDVYQAVLPLTPKPLAPKMSMAIQEVETSIAQLGKYIPQSEGAPQTVSTLQNTTQARGLHIVRQGDNTPFALLSEEEQAMQMASMRAAHQSRTDSFAEQRATQLEQERREKKQMAVAARLRREAAYQRAA